MTTIEKFKTAAIKVKDFTIENIGKRGVIIIAILIGIVIFAVGITLRTSNYIAYYDLQQMGNLGLLNPSSPEFIFQKWQIYRSISTNTLIAQIGAIITGVLLLIGAISPFSGKGTPYFSEYVRLGLAIFAGVLIYIAFMLNPTIMY